MDSIESLRRSLHRGRDGCGEGGFVVVVDPSLPLLGHSFLCSNGPCHCRGHRYSCAIDASCCLVVLCCCGVHKDSRTAGVTHPRPKKHGPWQCHKAVRWEQSLGKKRVRFDRCCCKTASSQSWAQAQAQLQSGTWSTDARICLFTRCVLSLMRALFYFQFHKKCSSSSSCLQQLHALR